MLLKAALPILFVADVNASAEFFRDKLGFRVDFLHGDPPFYGAVSRDSATLHLKAVWGSAFDISVRDGENLIMAFISVDDVQALYDEYKAAGISFRQTLTKQAWGGTDFHVADPDGNVIAFAG